MIFNFLIYFFCFMIIATVVMAMLPLFVFLVVLYGVGMLIAVLI